MLKRKRLLRRNLKSQAVFCVVLAQKRKKSKTVSKKIQVGIDIEKMGKYNIVK